MANQLNTIVTVNGKRYRVTGVKHAGASGSKFWGKYTFTLRNINDGNIFTAFGKAVVHNSRLTRVPCDGWGTHPFDCRHDGEDQEQASLACGHAECVTGLPCKREDPETWEKATGRKE